ncbi:MAG: hypothetical protein ACREDM_06575 [Methylocella sp.]
MTFVSGKGFDTGTCAEAQPCRTFQFAIGQTSASGEVKVLDPANYGGVTITQSISIAGIEGAGIDHGSGNAITINAGPNDEINLAHLTVDGLKTGGSGIVLNSGGSLTITHCVVRNFTNTGVFLTPTAGTTQFLIAGTLVSDNGTASIEVIPLGGSVQGALDHVSMNKAGLGIGVQSNGNVTVVGSIASNNAGSGFFTEGGGILRLAHSAATGNGIGVFNSSGTVVSAGDNFINGNGTDVSGTLTNVSTK